MYRTLSELRNSIDNLIEQQGENAACAAFVFTKEDVFFYPKDENGFENLDEQVHLNAEDTDDVLLELGGCDYIYEQVFEIIEDEVKRVRNKVAV
jgi:shikimate kinase